MLEEGSGTLGQIAQEGCGICVHGGVQDLARQNEG